MSKTLAAGGGKVREAKPYWETQGAPLEMNREERRVARSAWDRWHLFSLEGIERIHISIGDEKQAGRQVLRRTLTYVISMAMYRSNRVMGGQLPRLGYKRRRGRMIPPPINEQRKAGISRLLVKIDRA